MKRRKVQFSDPPVSDLAEIPRTPSGQKSSLKTSLKTKLKTKAVAELKEDDSCGLYVATPPLVEAPPAPTALYPALAEATEPLGAVLNDLSSAVLQKLAEKSLAEVGVKSVGDLAKMTAPQASKVKGLMPPNNVATILEALKKFEVRSVKKSNNRAVENSSKAVAKEKVVSPVLDVSTPEEEEKTMKDLYERPSPQPDESEQEPTPKKQEQKTQEKREKGTNAETMTVTAATEAVGTMTVSAASEAVGTMTVNLGKKDTANAEVQSDVKETANAEVQSSSAETASSNAQTEWSASAVYDVFMENCGRLSGKQLLAAIGKATATLESKMSEAN